MDLINCAAETTAVGDSSKFTEPMEESLGLATALLAKRKAESEPAEDVEESGEDEEYVDSDDESEEEEPVDEAMAFALAFLANRKLDTEEVGYEVDESDKEDSGIQYIYDGEELTTIIPKWWVEPEWDVDSFDGLEYDSAEDEDQFSDVEVEQKWRRFKRQLTESKGFYVEPELMPMYNYSRFKAVGDLERSAGFGQTYREYFAEMACLCLQKYNQENSVKNGFNVEFVEVVRGAFTPGSKSKSYITFMATEKPDGPLVEYQCKVWCTFVQHENYPILCRPAPTPKLSNQN